MVLLCTTSVGRHMCVGKWKLHILVYRLDHTGAKLFQEDNYDLL